jgi:plastocyanin
MNNKIIALIAIIIVLGGGWWIYKSKGERVPIANIESTTTQQMEEEPPVIDLSLKEFTVVGTSFAFAPSKITVNKGDTVKINFINNVGFHDFVIDEFNAKTKQLKAGESETITFVADKSGTFEYYCSVGTHRQQGMVGTLTVN